VNDGRASRTTAEVTGAFALMVYDEVKRYAGRYDHQNFFVKTQDQAKQDLTRALSGVSFLSRGRGAAEAVRQRPAGMRALTPADPQRRRYWRTLPPVTKRL
jgi:hypothetical protein